MRCFLGTELPQGVKKNVGEARDLFGSLDADIKVVKDENLHLTVKFLGQIKERDISKVDVLENRLEDLEPFDLEIRGMGSFPNMDYMKVLWVGAGKGGRRFKEIISKTDKALVKKGFKKDKNDPVPHITIGRVKSGRNKELIRSKLKEWEDRNFGSMKVNNITLFESNLTPDGPIYKKIKDYEL